MWELVGAIGGIVLVDLALSGDNALVIGAAASGLPVRQRRMAILLGGGGAILLRILFAAAATLLLQLPLLQAAGGLLLIWIAYRLLASREQKLGEAAVAQEQEQEHATRERRGFGAALVTILLADVTMSLDNVLAVGALAGGRLLLLAAGLLLSMALVLAGSAVVATLIRRLPWLLDVAALVLGWTAANMVSHDLRLDPMLEQWAWSGVVIHALGIGIVLALDVALRLRVRARARNKAAATSGAEVELSERQISPRV